MTRPRKLLERLGKAAPAVRTAAIDISGVAGVAAIVHGLGLIYEPAAWISGGLAALAASVLLQRSRKAA